MWKCVLNTVIISMWYFKKDAEQAHFPYKVIEWKFTSLKKVKGVSCDFLGDILYTLSRFFSPALDNCTGLGSHRTCLGPKLLSLDFVKLIPSRGSEHWKWARLLHKADLGLMIPGTLYSPLRLPEFHRGQNIYMVPLSWENQIDKRKIPFERQCHKQAFPHLEKSPCKVMWFVSASSVAGRKDSCSACAILCVNEGI